MEAEWKCREWGGTLTSIHSKEEQVVVNDMLKDDESYLIGLNDQSTECDWKWQDESRIKWTNWDLGKPSGSNDQNKDCTVVAANKKWQDVSCDDFNKYVCKRKAGLVVEDNDFTY
jgi:hypothetical protein